MEAQSVVVIQDASNEINSKVFHWAQHGLSLKAGDMLTLVAVLHQVITPMGYKIPVDSRLMIGANQNIIEEQAARKKEEYLNNEELVQIFKLYKSKKVGFRIEMATGSSPRAVAVKSAMKLKATWLILDRKMKNDEEYLLQKLSCGISRIRRQNRIIRLRGPLDLPKETRRDSSYGIYAASIPLPDISTEQDPFIIEIISHSHGKDYEMNEEKGQRQKNPHGEEGLSALDNNQTVELNHDQLSMDKKDMSSKQLVWKTKRDQQCQDKEQNGEETDPKLKQKLKENNSNISCGGNNRETQEQERLSSEEYQKSERYLSSGGARNFFQGRAEEYRVCKQFFNLSN